MVCEHLRSTDRGKAESDTVDQYNVVCISFNIILLFQNASAHAHAAEQTVKDFRVSPRDN